MSIPCDRVGSVIGKKGSVMREIENDCKVCFSDRRTVEVSILCP